MYSCKRAICIIQYSDTKEQYDMFIRCLNSYKRNQPQDKIFVFNNSSPYFEDIDDKDITIMKIPNYRELGAIYIAYLTIKAEQYLFVHDSTESFKTLPDYFWERDFMSLWSFSPVWMIYDREYRNFLDNTMSKNISPDIIEKINLYQKNAIQYAVWGCFGLMFMAKRHVMDKLDEIGIFKCALDIKIRDDACGTERLITCAFHILGYPISCNNLQGDIHTYPMAWGKILTQYSNDVNQYFIRKTWHAR